MTTKVDRQTFLAGLPWITHLKKPQDCEGIKWGTVAMKDIYASGPRANPVPARGIQEKSRCKNKGWWKLRALKIRKSDPWEHNAQSGTYCWSHLVQQIYTSEREVARLNKAWDAR